MGLGESHPFIFLNAPSLKGCGLNPHEAYVDTFAISTCNFAKRLVFWHEITIVNNSFDNNTRRSCWA